MMAATLAAIAFWAWFCLAFFERRNMRAFWLVIPTVILGVMGAVLTALAELLTDIASIKELDTED